jgi:hypothetical protein
VIVSFSMGLIALMMLNGNNEKNFGVLPVFSGLLAYGLLELMVQQKHHYKSGVDDALLWGSGSCIIAGVNVMGDISATLNAVFILIFALYFFLRFANSLAGVVATLSFLATVFLLYTPAGYFAISTAPFLMLLLSAGIYFLADNLYRQSNCRFYKQGLLLIKITMLIALYAAVNYFVVREASVSLFNIDVKENESIPFGWLFWCFTIFIPAAYIFWGIKKKDAVVLRVGLLLVAAIVFTVRYYHSVLLPETAMTFGGLLLTGIAYWLIRYLKQPKHGFTYAETTDNNPMNKLNIEALVIAETFNTAQPDDNTKSFGGGSFGGGGASGEF